ncbi:MAG TPA: c-type cytochrome [Kofleriaceae bacterium]|nr:c-type cytochrome [Kofleriaceae bacterium]
MRTRTLALGILAAAASVPRGGLAQSKPLAATLALSPAFQLIGRPLGGGRPAAPTPAHLTASRIAADGENALVIDADSGALLRADAAGKTLGQVAIARDAGLMTYDPTARIAYVADRRHDRVAVVKLDTMTIASSIATPAEPYGVALSPDRTQLLVSTIADRTLVAYDAATGRERWRTALGSEPRGLAVSPDGTRALVSYLTTGTVDQIDLRTHRADHMALTHDAPSERCRHCGADGPSFARAAFAVTFLGDRLAVAPFQREVPVQDTDGTERAGNYGGGSESPLTHELAFFRFGGELTEQATAVISQHQPRAVAWDGARDALYIAGMGSDTVIQIRDASQASAAPGTMTGLGTGETCGPDGLAVTPSGQVLAWCSFSRRVARIAFSDPHAQHSDVATVMTSPTLIASAMTPKQHDGMVLFHIANPAVSEQGNLACASCHPDSRADGLSWRIEKHELQTPLLAGRLVGTHPYKWDGGDATLRDSLRSTMRRLGGFGLSRRDTDALAAYLESLPAVRAPTRDPAQVARGKQVFEAEGCQSCHDGPAYTDRQRHKLAGTLRESDTPSLIGVAASAPYFHDGSAATLEALLRDRGAVHGMADTARLSDHEIADLTAFLDTL